MLVVAVTFGYFQQRDIRARYIEFQQNEERLEEVRQEIEALRFQVDEARHLVENLENDSVEKEAAVRRIRRLTRDGEIIYRIEDEQMGDDAAAPSTRVSSPPATQHPE